MINRRRGLNNDQAFFYLVEGYRETTKIIIDKISESDNWLEKDSLLLPLLFNFRHYIEIVIKDTLRNYKILGNEIEFNQVGFKNTHSLLSLWEELKIFVGDSKSSASVSISETLNEIEEVDKISDGFRYPFKGSKNECDEVKYIFGFLDVNIEELINRINLSISFFEGINSMSIEILSQRQSDQF